jgi:enoyl-CoA hydratase
MSIESFMLDPSRLWSGEQVPELPLAFVSLGVGGDWPDEPTLPPFPVVGVGDPAHPFARHLDCVIEPPIGAASLTAQVQARPNTAAAIVQLLRILPTLGLDEGLTAESMTYGLLQGSAEHRDWLSAERQTGGEQGMGKVLVSRESDRLFITLDNPAHDNAIDRAVRDQLYEALELATLDPDIAQVLLRAVGRTFSMGALLSEFGTTTDPATAHAIRARTLPARMAVRCADRLDVHVQGGCVGSGLELAAFASRLTAAPNAWFQLPELSMGILPGAGGCVSLTHRIGRQRTALMILSGKRISAKQALAWGLVDAIVDEPPTD